MAISKDQLKARLPLPAYSYRVRVGSEVHSFSQVSGLTFQYETITYRHGLSVIEGADHLIGLQQDINVTLQRGIIRQGSLLLEWISGVHLGNAVKQDLTVDLCDENGDAIVSWVVYNALPTTYEASTLEASSSDVALETLSLIANNMRVTYHNSEQTGGTRVGGSAFYDLINI